MRRDEKSKMKLLLIALPSLILAQTTTHFFPEDGLGSLFKSKLRCDVKSGYVYQEEHEVGQITTVKSCAKAGGSCCATDAGKILGLFVSKYLFYFLRWN